MDKDTTDLHKERARMRKLNLKKGLIFVLALIVYTSIVVFINNLEDETITMINENAVNETGKEELHKHFIRERGLVDLNGDGNTELILSFSRDTFFDDKTNIDGYMAVFDKSGNQIATSLENFIPVWSTLPGHMWGYQFDDSDKTELIRLRIVAGTHHFENIFMRLVDDVLVPVCKTNIPESENDCVFYNTRGEIFMEDVDDDGVTEIFELVDEYPPTGGRGRGVIGGIYRYNGEIFEPQVGEGYSRLFDLLPDGFSDYIKNTDIEDSGLDENRRFWSGERPL